MQKNQGSQKIRRHRATREEVMDQDLSELKVDVGVLQTQVETITKLCGKMDTVIEKLVDQHDRHIAKVYTDMDARRMENDQEISKINNRIDTMLEKIQASELRIMEKIDTLRSEMQDHNKQEKQALDNLLQWKWTVAGGIIAISWLISHMDLTILDKLIK